MLVHCVQSCSTSTTAELKCNYRVQGFFTPLNFHELFWICEIKLVKCCGNVIAVLVAIMKFLVKTHGFVKI